MTAKPHDPHDSPTPRTDAGNPGPRARPPAPAKEVGGPKGPEPTRYGDWEVNGRCSDF